MNNVKELQTIDETLKYLQFDNWEQSEPGLSRSYELLGLLGNPQEKLKFVHIAGTNGKGSTAAMLASVLQSAGYRTGLYTSPHLLRFHERMRVCGREIDDASLIALTNTVRTAADGMSEMPTGFEIMTAIAFLYFVQEKCDIVALEVGLGGRMDSTNVIPAPEVCVVTNIGLEHTAILGDTLEKIATEKCGIIKHGAHAVLFGQTDGVENVARETCAREDVPLTITAQSELTRISSSLDGQVFLYRGHGPFHLRLLGEYQLLNALTVVDVSFALRARGWMVVASALDGADFYQRPEVGERFVLVIGSEAHGISEEVRAQADALVKLPMRGRAESLNAAVAAGIMMYEMTRS